MATAQLQVVENQATCPAVGPFTINLGFQPTSFHFWNQTKYNANSANQISEGEWNQFLPAGYLYADVQSGSNTDNKLLMTSGGITLLTGKPAPLLGAAVTGTTIAKSTGTFTVTSSAGLYPGSIVQITNNAVMKQIGGQYFQVGTVPLSTTFTITNPAFMNTSNFTNETNFVMRPVINPVQFFPNVMLITAITQANPMVVTTAVSHNLVVGQEVKIYVPSAFGMTQANGISAIITAVTAQTFTLGSVNSLGFTAFAWPAVPSGTTLYWNQFPQVVPQGSGPNGLPASDTLSDQVYNQAYQGVLLGSGDGTNLMPVNGDVIQYRAIRADINQ
jgi:hypothetical protein